MRHIVALSGGKDSVCMALRLAELEPRDYEYVCTPTGWELPPMVDHWRRLEELLGKHIVCLPTHTMDDLIQLQQALPNWRMRWCTRKIKIIPFEKYLRSVGEC